MISNIGQSVFQRLINRAKSMGEDPNHILSRYATERFLYRLSISKYTNMFVLKGSSLFLVWKGQNYRVTRDADLLGLGDPDANRLLQVFKEICNMQGAEDDAYFELS